MEEAKASSVLARLESLPLDERGEALTALIDELESDLNEAGSAQPKASSTTNEGPPSES